MIERVLTDRAGIDALRGTLARERTLFEVRAGDAGFDWQSVDGKAPFAWDAPAPLAGAKRFFLAPRETLFRWDRGAVEPVAPSPAPFVLFGVHACDLAAIAHQDRFFAGDPWYAGRRAAALLVGRNCLAACTGGFCHDVDAGPFSRAAFDLNLTVLGDRVMVELGTAAGRRAWASAAGRTTAVDDAAQGAFAAAERSAIDSFPERAFVADGIGRMREGMVAGEEWAALSAACFACTGCTNVCPTCSCFTTADQVQGEGGERLRVWDSCLLEGFQREASGHHPAPRPADRVRRFWYHKLSDDFVPPCPRIGCVGCGRCDVTCPGSIGALRVLGTLGKA